MLPSPLRGAVFAVILGVLCPVVCARQGGVRCQACRLSFAGKVVAFCVLGRRGAVTIFCTRDF